MDDRASEVCLQGKDILKVLLVGPRPELRIGRAINESRRDTSRAIGARHRAFDNGIDMELLRDLVEMLLQDL